jgi:CBS domain-containing protein
MKLSEVMHTNVEVVSGDTTVRDAARRMKELDVGALPVRVGDVLAGMVTDRDLVVRSIARGDNPDEVRVAEVMTQEAACCYVDDSIEQASRIMSQHQIQRLLVLGRDQKLAGIVSLGDLARARGNSPTVTNTLEEIKAPTKPSAIGTSRHQIGH